MKNTYLVCSEHAAKPDPKFQGIPKEEFYGHWVKISFPGEDNCIVAEHMWVMVTGSGQTKELHGHLDNTPEHVFSIKHGDAVELDRSQIEDVI